MRKLYLILLIALFFIVDIHASHIVGGEIKVQHLNGYSYRIEMNLYRDIGGISAPATALINVSQRNLLSQDTSWTLTMDTSFLMQPQTVGCGTPPIQIEKYVYSDVVTMDPSTYNSNSGYILSWNSCCRNAGILNIQNSSGAGSTIMTMIPPVLYNGNQVINSTPVLNSPSADFAIQGHPYYLDFGGYDPDGDSLSYQLFTPFEDNPLTSGVVNPISAPYPDPSTMATPIIWAQCFNEDNQINGFSDPNCNSLNEPDRLQVNAITGELTMVPGVVAPSYSLFGIWCQEWRDIDNDGDKELIGSVFRDFQIAVTDYQIDPNTAPQVHVPQLQSLATWDGDTMVFTGSPVCVQLGVTDPDSIADVEIEAVYSDYDPGDLTFVSNSAIVMHPDTFMTALCFQPDSFLSYTTEGQVVALNPGCYDLRGDTLPFYFRFDGYSNAGWGGVKNVPIGQNDFNLFAVMDYNPNPGGLWVDIDNSGLMLSDGTFLSSQVTGNAVYRFYYIDEQPNYPADTAYLELRYVQPNALESEIEEYTAVYPNPSNGSFNIEVSENLVGRDYTIMDIRSQIIESGRIKNALNSINIDLNGIYFLRIEGSSEVHKLIFED